METTNHQGDAEQNSGVQSPESQATPKSSASPKTEEVYCCPECDEWFHDRIEAANHCVNEDIPREYRCLHCGFIWPSVDQAIRCYDIEVAADAVRAA